MLIIVPPIVTYQVAEQNIVSEQSPLRIWQGRSARYTIEWTSRNITVHEQNHSDIKQVFNLESCANGVFEKHRQYLVEETGNVGRCNFASYYKITSVVGQYLCLHEQFLGVYEATKSSSQKTFRTIDLAKAATKYDTSHTFSNYEALLTDIVPDSALIEAFLNNPFIQQAFKARGARELSDIQKDTLTSIGNFVDAIQARNIYIEDAAGNRNYSFDIDLRNFVIRHLSDGIMGIRILLPNPAILADTPLQLDLNIQIPNILQNALEKANTKSEGFLMDKRNLMLKEATTVFRRTLLPPYHEFEPL